MKGKFKNYQGQNMRDLKAENRAKIVEWRKNNEGSMKQCSDDTDICYATVRAHFAEMRVEAGQ